MARRIQLVNHAATARTAVCGSPVEVALRVKGHAAEGLESMISTGEGVEYCLPAKRVQLVHDSAGVGVRVSAASDTATVSSSVEVT